MPCQPRLQLSIGFVHHGYVCRDADEPKWGHLDRSALAVVLIAGNQLHQKLKCSHQDIMI
jgi:hypothetical protein